jgi:hypothetical protein
MPKNFFPTPILPGTADFDRNTGRRSAGLPEAVSPRPGLSAGEDGAPHKGVPPSALND